MQDLVTAFVDGKVQNRFKDLSRALEEFFLANQPIIEELNVLMQDAKKKSWLEISSGEVQEVFRKDLENSRKCLASYTRIFSRVDNTLAMIASNFKLPQFIAENSIGSNKITDFYDELAKYWDITYGQYMVIWNKIKVQLEFLRKTLEYEIFILERMPQTSYYEGFQKNTELRSAFMRERDTFYEVWKFYEQSNSLLRTEIEGRLKAQIARSRGELLAMAKELRRKHDNNFSAAQTHAQKSVIIIYYLMGAYLVYRNAKTNTLNKGLTKFRIRLGSWMRDSHIEKTNQNLVKIRDKTQELVSAQAANSIDLASRIEEIAFSFA